MKIRINWLLLFSVLFLTACTSPRQLIREFTSNPQLPPLLYISDPAMFISFYRPEEFADSLLYFKPEKIVYFLDDSIAYELKDIYDLHFLRSLREQGFPVFGTDSIHAFFAEEQLRWQLSPVQVTFEEHRIPFSRELPFNDYTVYYDTIISEYQLNVWLELSPVSGDSSVPVHLLFHSSHLSDKVKGRFIFDWGSRIYRFSYDFIEADSLVFHELAQQAAALHAAYLFDFFLNRHFYLHLEKRSKKPVYYTFDRQRKRAFPAKDNRFIFIHNEP